jgi:hypothetical protein
MMHKKKKLSNEFFSLYQKCSKLAPNKKLRLKETIPVEQNIFFLDSRQFGQR